MAKFNWDQLQDAQVPAETKGGKFSWDQFQDARPQKENDLVGAVQVGVEHFGNAASLGYLPQIQAVASKLTPDPNTDVDAKLATQGFNIQQPKPATYVQERDANIKRLEQQSQDHPYASGVGTIAGSLAGGAAASGLAPISAATRLGRVAQAAKGGAILGAVSNPGDKEGEVDLLQSGDRISGALGGAALGGAGQGVIEGASAAAKGMTGLGTSLKAKAQERAVKAGGAMLKDYRQLAGQERVDEIGRYMLDNGLIKPGMSVKEIASAAEKLQGKHGEAISEILTKLDDAGHVAPSGKEMADVVRAQAAPLENLNTAKPTYNTLQDVAADIETMAANAKNGSFKTAQDIKRFVADQVEASGGFKALNPTEKNLALRKVYGIVKDKMEEGAQKAAEAAGSPELLQNYLKNKTGFRNAGDVANMAGDQALRQNANRFFSPSDYFSGGMGAVVGAASGGDSLEEKLKHAAVGAGLGLANKAARTYGTPLMSVGLDKAAGLLAKTPLASLGKASKPVLEAAERSPGALATTIGISRPNFERAPIRGVADQNLKGETRWAQNGLEKLGIRDQAMASRILQSKEGKRLLIEASDLSPGSRGMTRIKEQIDTLQKGLPNDSLSGVPPKVLRREREPARGR